jgi:hypothetical protein
MRWRVDDVPGIGAALRRNGSRSAAEWRMNAPSHPRWREPVENKPPHNPSIITNLRRGTPLAALNFTDFVREIGAPGTIRTSDPQIRSLMLYPAELRARAA